MNFISKFKNILHFLVKDGCIAVKFYSIFDYVRNFRDFQFLRETGSKYKKRSMKKFRRVGWGYVIQNQISPNFRFPEVRISASGNMTQ